MTISYKMQRNSLFSCVAEYLQEFLILKSRQREEIIQYQEFATYLPLLQIARYLIIFYEVI